MTESDTPNSWSIAKLAELGQWYGGGTPSKSKKSFWSGDIPWVSPKDMKVSRIHDTADHITQGAVEQSAAKLINENSVLIVTRSGILAHTLPVATAARPVTLNQDLKALTPAEGIDAEYVAWALSAFQREILDTCRKGGTTVHSIELPNLMSFSIPIAPTKEQERIVAKIEELFSELDKAVESLTKVRTQLRAYHQAILKHAFDGKLSANWRADNEDKSETPEQLLGRLNEERQAHYERQLEDWKAQVQLWEAAGSNGRKPTKPSPPSEIEPANADGLPSLPEGWLWVRLGQISVVTGGLTKNQKRNSLSRKMKYLRVANVYADKVRADDIQDIGVTEDEARKVELLPGDLLVVEGNGSIEQIGRVAMWEGQVPECGHQNHLIRVRAATRSNPRFVLQFMLSSTGRAFIVEQASSTSGLHTLSISKVSDLVVPVTSLAEEDAVLGLIDEKLSRTERLLEDIEAQLALAEAARQSILKRAFSGKLVQQNSTDEPASVLLERIRANEEESSTKRKSNKAKGRRDAA